MSVSAVDHPPGNGKPLEVVVWGPMACFTRPEAKAERLTYPVPTPSAARGILEAIYWKPEFRYRVREIHVLKKIRYASILRNEVTDKMPDPRREKPTPFDVTERRAQRHTLCLIDVAYRIVADVTLRPDVPDDPAKFRDQFRRRVERGQCFHRPGLGCREFAADFAPPRDLPKSLLESLPDGLTPIDTTQDLGLMLFDMAFNPVGTDGYTAPLFFEARLERGRLVVDDTHYQTLERLSGQWRPGRTPRPADFPEEEDATP